MAGYDPHDFKLALAATAVAAGLAGGFIGAATIILIQGAISWMF